MDLFHWHSLSQTGIWAGNFDDLVQNCSISSALAMDVLQSCTKPSTLSRAIAKSSFSLANNRDRGSGHLVPKTTRTQDNSYPRQLVPKTTCTPNNSYPEMFDIIIIILRFFKTMIRINVTVMFQVQCGCEHGVRALIQYKDVILPDRLIFNMGIPVPGEHGLYIKTGPRTLYSSGWLQKEDLKSVSARVKFSKFYISGRVC